MASLLPKLDEILKDKYRLKKSVKRDVEFLKSELASMHTALGNVAEVPREELEEQVKLWDKQVRELSHRTEVVVDTFLGCVEYSEHSANPNSFRRLTNKLFSKDKARRQIASSIRHIKEQVQDVAARNDWYRDWCKPSPKPAAPITVDPRLRALYTGTDQLVGVHEKSEEVMKLLFQGDEVSKMELRTVSIVGIGGSGKTSLARAVYDKIKGDFECAAFVSVGFNAIAKKVLVDILSNLHKQKYPDTNYIALDEPQLIDELRSFLTYKRYLVVIDDIWGEREWEIIKLGLVKNNFGSRIITITRILSVSHACLSSSDDSIYRVKPLSDGDSKRLFYKRIFSQESDCPHEFEQISGQILKKCCGLPLAIITMASILLGSDQQMKSKDEWHRVFNSIGRGLTEDGSMSNVQNILSFSYYDLPSHLKTCLLYLSMFPNGYEIERDQLIWRWIAEGFFRDQGRGVSLFELGESYFNGLINRSMIQPIYIDCEGRVKSCRVHDMVLDLLCSLSSEENFVIILDKQSTLRSQSSIRRLSLQNSMAEDINHGLDTTSMSQVRSVIAFSPAANMMPSLSCFRALRVLDLEDCDLSKSCHQINLSYVGNLFHLRYLGLNDINGGKLPIKIGNLQFLQTLYLRGDGIKTLPSSVIQLRRLMCLHIEGSTVLPVGVRNLTSIEELNKLQVDRSSPYIVKELGHMVNLRLLVIYWGELDESLNTDLVHSLSNLHKLESLKIEAWGGHLNAMGEDWVPPLRLRRFESCGEGSFSTLPRWISPSSLPFLCHLVIYVDELRWEDIQTLGMLPALLSLFLNVTGCVEKLTVDRFVVSTGAYPSLRECCFYNFVTVPSMFPEGAMPRLQFIRFSLRARDIDSSNLDMSMGHLPSLERVRVDLWCDQASITEVEETEAAVRQAADAHPNSITVHIERLVKGMEELRSGNPTPAHGLELSCIQEAGAN